MRKAFGAKLPCSSGVIVLLSLLFPSLPSLAKSGGFRLEQRVSFVGEPYDSVRTILMSRGWEPENVHYRYEDYPEIHCSLSGNCIGYWRKNMKELYVGIDVGKEPFVTLSIQSEQEYRRENAE